MKKLISIILAVTLITTSIPPKAAEASFFTDPQEVEIPVAQESGKVSSSSLTSGHSPNVPIFSQSPMQIGNEPESAKLEVEAEKLRRAQMGDIHRQIYNAQRAIEHIKQKKWYYITTATVIVVTVVTYIVYRRYRQAPSRGALQAEAEKLVRLNFNKLIEAQKEQEELERLEREAREATRRKI